MVLAVDNLNLSVQRGEIFGFLGPNGAGKSTTMRMLLGLVRPTSGAASMLGMDVNSQIEPILAKTGAIIENPTFYPFLNGWDNLRIVARLKRTTDAQVSRVLQSVDLQGDAHRKYKTYSMGMKQRLAVAATLLSEPELLILDEPANGLDPAGIVEMRKLMITLKSEGRTVFISSHVLHEIEQICDRIAILNHGRVVAQGSVDALLHGHNQVEIKTTESGRACEILRPLDWVERVTTTDGGVVVDGPSDRSADLNKALAQAGIYASQIKVVEATLEQYFLDVTDGPHA